MWTCASCGMTFEIEELGTFFGVDFIRESFRIVNIMKKMHLTNEELALMKAVTVLYTGEITLPVF